MNNLLASLMYFTRLPFWRLKSVPSECFERVVVYWPFAGWLIGGIMIGSYVCADFAFSPAMSWVIAIAVRLLLTGAMHCDGYADFLDGFGGGITRDRILAIMKDSHIGTYGVIGLIIYFMLLWQVSNLPATLMPVIILCGNTWPRFVSGQVINFLPYARKLEDSKAKVVYKRMSPAEWLTALMFGALPLLLLPLPLMWAVISPIVVASCLIALMKKKIGGYTGDCCGALFILTELSFYLTVLAIDSRC